MLHWELGGFWHKILMCCEQQVCERKVFVAKVFENIYLPLEKEHDVVLLPKLKV